MSLQRRTFAEMLTFTRAGTATYFDANGVMQTAAADQPRFDYDPITLACKGLLIEGSRTNLLLRSSDIANASWAKDATTIGETVSSSYPTAATRIYETATTGEHGFTAAAAAYTAGQVYTLHTVLRSAGRTRARVLLPSAAFGENKVGYYDLQSLSVVSTLGTGVTAAISPVRDGCVMLILTATATTSASASAGQFRFVDSGTNVSYAGSASLGMDFIYAQLEVGAFPSSYIPTTTAAVTRAADVCLMTGADFSRWFNPVEGTIVAEFSTITNGLDNTGGNGFFWIYDIDSSGAATSSHELLVSATYGPGINARTQVAGTSQAALTTPVTLGTGSTIRHAYAYKTNDFAGSLNGGSVLADAAGSLPPAPDRMAIGSTNGGSGSHLNGHLRRIRYYPRRLDNARLQELTA